MSDLYESIPSGRRDAYEQNAQEAMQQVVHELGSAAVHGAEQLAAEDASGIHIAREASEYIQANDLSKNFMEAMDHPRESGIGDQAQVYVNLQAAHGAARKNSDNYKPWDVSASDQLGMQIANGSDELIRDLTRKRQFPEAPHERPDV